MLQEFVALHSIVHTWLQVAHTLVLETFVRCLQLLSILFQIGMPRHYIVINEIMVFILHLNVHISLDYSLQRSLRVPPHRTIEGLSTEADFLRVQGGLEPVLGKSVLRHVRVVEILG